MENINSITQSTAIAKPPLHDYLKESRMKRQNMAKNNLESSSCKSLSYFSFLIHKILL